MTILFIDPVTLKTTGSTELGKAVLSSAVKTVEPEVAKELSSTSDWRKRYQGAFAKVAKAEFKNPQAMLEVAINGLAEFEKRLVTDSGENLVEVVRTAWRTNKDLVATVVVKGVGPKAKPEVKGELTISEMLSKHLAEPGIEADLKILSKNSNYSIENDLLTALAGGAEYSPTRLWLDWGGATAIVARSREELWQELIARARSGGGTLYVPVLKSKLNGVDAQALSDLELAKVAGLDLVEDHSAIAGWLSMLARSETRRLVLGGYAYAPGAKHIQVQGVQHALGRVLTESLPKSRVVLTWLATPTDSHVVPVQFAHDIQSRFASRSAFTKFRDFLYGAREHKPLVFKDDSGGEFALIDPTSSLQGSSYALAKRVQRWMAYQQLASDRKVIYLVSPPAHTDSVLSHRILRASYAGAPHFGLVPFKTDSAVSLAACLLLAELSKPTQEDKVGSTSLYTRLAVHGGLWRSIYRPNDLWRAATVRGIFGYFK